MPDTLTITRDWFAMLESLPTVQSRWNVLYAVARFAFDGEKPDGLNALEKGIFVNIKNTISSRKRCNRYYSKNKDKRVNHTCESHSSKSEVERVNHTCESHASDDLFSVTSNQHSNTNISPNCLSKDKHTSPTGKNSNARRVFKVPTLEEVRDYISGKGYSVDPEEFFSFYESQGWHVGKNKMRDWHRAVSYWQCRINNRNKTRTQLRDYSGI